MYVILVNDDNTLSAPRKERIMQRSKLVDDLWFLSKPVYKNVNLTSATVSLEYVLPVSRQYRNEILKLDGMYEDHLKYVLPFDTCLTAEAGKIELTISFLLTDLDASGNAVQRVRKTDPIEVDIIPVTKWADIVPDSALSAIDQRIIKTDAQIHALNEFSDYLYASKADNIMHNEEDNTIQLLAGGNPIGDRITLEDGCECNPEDGVPVVEFAAPVVPEPEQPENVDNVVEF